MHLVILLYVDDGIILFVSTEKQKQIRKQKHLMIIHSTLLLTYSVQYSYYCTIKFKYFVLDVFSFETMSRTC